MGETANYGLYVTDDSTEKFLDWREQMNGETDSNMTKIDAILADKADQSTMVRAVLTAEEWSGEAAPFMQELRVPGLSADSNGMISIAQDATLEQREMVRECGLSVVEQGDGVLWIAADGKKPAGDIPVYVILLG